MFTSRKFSARARGFTLLELAMALTLLVLVAGSIYAVMKGSIDSAAVLNEDRNRRQQIDGFLQLCRRTFLTLPPYATLESRIRSKGSLALPEVIFRRAPSLLMWEDVEDFDAISVLGIREETGGRYSIALLRVHDDGNQAADPIAKAPATDWLVLVPDVLSAKWRFFNPGINSWMDILPPNSPRPTAAELTLELAGEKEPVRAVFQIVPLVNNPQFNPRGRGGPGNNRNPNQPGQLGGPNQPGSPPPEAGPGQGQGPGPNGRTMRAPASNNQP